MTDQQGGGEFRTLLDGLGADATGYFERAMDVLPNAENEDSWPRLARASERDQYWAALPEALRAEAERLNARLLSLMGQVATAIRSASLASEADQRDVMTGTKAMRAALFLRNFRSMDIEILNDEDIVLGVRPAHQSDDEPATPALASRTFAEWKGKISAVLDLVAASPGLSQPDEGGAIEAARYRPGTAFIMMWMDPLQPELTDISDAVKEVFGQFDIHAVRADDIQHEGLITQRILSEIKTAEFCFADLSGGRPNVYYEVGYAHALARRVILYRKAGTGLHFDLVGYNCPEYANLRDLKAKLTQRLRHLTNKEPRA